MSKVSEQMHAKAQQFLATRCRIEDLTTIIEHFDSGNDLSSCILTFDLIFTHLLRDRTMYVHVIPLKPTPRTPDIQFKELLRQHYEQCFKRIVACLEHDSSKIQTQSLATSMNLLAHESRYPLEDKANFDCFVPLIKLKTIIIKLLSAKLNQISLIEKLTEYLLYNDVLYYIWKVLPGITVKINPNKIYINNYLLLLNKLYIHKNLDDKLLLTTPLIFNFDEKLTKRCLNIVWSCIMVWDHNPSTHRQMLIVLLERVLSNLDKPLLLVDFLMDSLDIGGEVSLLALQGIFRLILTYNLNYPNIYEKLYSMFEPEIFHIKFKSRLFHLADLFLSSTHLPENLVAAFVKRLARLALIAPSEDVIVICMFIGNLILRHPGLKCLLNRPNSDVTMANDPYIMEESDPFKSNAIYSSLWEMKTLQSHVQPSVATAARFIDDPLPTVEWDMDSVLSHTNDDLFDRELKKSGRLIVMAFNRNNDKMRRYWSLY